MIITVPPSALPGTGAEVVVLMERARLGLQLFPLDARRDDSTRACDRSGGGRDED